MSPEQIDLVEQYLDHTLPAPGLRRLLDLLQQDESFRNEFAETLRLSGLLHAGVGPDSACDRLSDVVAIALPSGRRALESSVMALIQERGVPPPRASRKWGAGRRWSAAAAGLAAAVALAAGLWIVLSEPAPVRLVAAGSEIEVERGPDKLAARAPFTLRDGDFVNVPDRGWAWIRYQDGTTLQLGSETTVEIQGKPSDSKKVQVSRGTLFAEVAPQPADRPMVLASPHASTRVLGTSFSLAVARDATKLIVRQGKVAFAKPDGAAPIEVSSGHVATAVRGAPLALEPVRGELLRKLGKEHFLLGLMSGWGESWMSDSRKQGCRWDLRYQHLTAGWTQWNANGAFIPMYLEESERLGAVPVFTYYSLVRSSPAKVEPAEFSAEIARNCGNPAFMKKYLGEVKLFMQKAGAGTKPAILHVEPGVWAQFLSAPEFRPNILEKIQVAVRSTGIPELEGLDDSAASFGKAFGVLRDRFAPNVLLAWHVSKVDGLSAAVAADALLRCGTWDLLFTDVGDRDAGFKEARGIPNAWWKEKDFAEFREWGAQVYAQSGLALMVWRVPLGNTHMATCNNTPWHYMDNRVEYWLEGYPENRHIGEWADAGFVGLLFGGGSVECTVHRDNAKDGVTNPPPVAGNKGEVSVFPDDDGGYLRLRAGSYYQRGPLPIKGN